MNKGTNLLEKFEMAKKWENHETTSNRKDSINSNNANNPETNDNGQQNYSALLQNNFFGPDGIGGKNPTANFKTKIFQFKTDIKKRNTISTFKNGTNLDDSSDTINFTRKIASKPYKILDSPGLIDDFYLNLVDWSSKNDIAVGLNNSVYLWCANKTQIINLASYEGDKYVSSVMWNEK
jgi:hypothetical protein